MRSTTTALSRRKQLHLLIYVVALLTAVPPSAAAGDQILHSQYDGVPVPEVGTSSYGTIQWAERSADDFVVPFGQTWTIRGVDVRGEFASGAATTDSAYFGVLVSSAGTDGKPASPLGGALVRGSYAGSARDLALRDLRFGGAHLTLGSGRYWLTVISSTEPGGPATAATTARPWRWTNRMRQTGQAAVWKSDGVYGPVSPVSAACYRLWGWRASQCFMDPSNPDQVFRIWGTARAAT